MQDAPTAHNRYNHTAWFYEGLSGFYSAGTILASKLAELPFIQPGDRVLYAGVGGGQDAVAAAELGAEVTCVDLAPAMLDRTRRKLDERGAQAELVRGDVMDHDRTGHYDVVCANYLLNVFEPAVARTVFAHLVDLARPGGLLMFADFAVPRGGPIARTIHAFYNWLANASFWVLTRNPIHPVHDFEALAEEFGLVPRQTIMHRLFPGGPRYFQTTVTQKPAN
jgi:demethylphylloquinol methyltransferase